MPPSWGASALVHPARHKTEAQPPLPFENVAVESDGLTLRGWVFRTSQPRRGILLYLHGADDDETSPAHSQRVYAALAGPKKLFLVPGAGHNDVLSGGEVWAVIEAWLAALD